MTKQGVPAPAAYRRLFEQVLRLDTGDWQRIDSERFVCLNASQIQRVPADVGGQRQLVYCGLNADGDIRRFFAENPAWTSPRVLFLVRLQRDNLFHFSSAILDQAEVFFILDFVPESAAERLQAFNLFHKNQRLRKFAFAARYVDRILEMLSAPASLPPTPPDVIAGMDTSLLAVRAGHFGQRISNRLALSHFRSLLRAYASTLRMPRMSRPLRACRHVLITGWYGTETAGDKAILLELVHAFRERNPDTVFSVTSIIPGLSRLTNLETGLDLRVLELRSLDYQRLDDVDAVVFGGGPLMDSSQLRYIATLFQWARRRGLRTFAFGCGVGPLKTDAGRRYVSRILQATDSGFFRDQKSATKAAELGYRGPLLHACDPALRYVHRWQSRTGQFADGRSANRLVALLRAQTGEYSASAASETSALRTNIAAFLRAFLTADPARTVSLLPMHTFWLGNDDREFAKQIAHDLRLERQVNVCERTLDLDELLAQIERAGTGMPMRYHGHVFMLGMGIPFVSIDYTGRDGKIGNLLERYGLQEYSLTAAETTADSLASRWQRLADHRELVRARITAQLAADLEQLERVYDALWSDMPVVREVAA